MSIDAISSGTNAYSTTGLQPSRFKQVRQDFNDLANALQSGDLTGAQQAFTALQKDSPMIAQTLNNGNDPFSSALGNLATALKSGDLTGAQQAFAALQQVAQSVRHGHGHHHLNAADLSNSSSTSATSGTDSDGDNDNSSGSVLNATA